MSSKTIWKFSFEIDDRVVIRMPQDASILKVECQQGSPTMWALVDPDKPLEDRQFRIVGTGHPFPDANDLRHVATFQQPPFVWHVFEGRP